MSMDGDKWPLCNGGPFLKGLTFTWRSYPAPQPSFDHDHCELCLAKFMSAIRNVPDTLTEGYTTADLYRWVCKECFETYGDHFDWRKTRSPLP